MTRPASLYVTQLSHPAGAAAAMLAHKRLAYRRIVLPGGLHPALVRAAGFPGSTVPALELEGGRRVQGSLAISRVLEEVRPEPPLFPREREARRAVEKAERWGHDELQPMPRRLMRFALLHDPALRRWFLRDLMHWPAAGLVAAAITPVVRELAGQSDAEEPIVRNDLRRLPALLDRVDGLIAAGTVGAAPNAADFQILASVRVLLEFVDLSVLIEGRPCAARARRLFPRWEGPIPHTAPLAG